MSIKFVDKEPEGAGKSRKADTPSVKRDPDADALQMAALFSGLARRHARPLARLFSRLAR